MPIPNGPLMTSPDDLETVRALALRAANDLRAVRESLIGIEAASQENQVLLLAAVLESARKSRTGIQDLCVHLGEAAMSRGASPRLLDWSDGTPS
jgi:hypothetical protein